MITPEILDYIRKSLAAGTAVEDIKKALASQGGWQMADIDKAIAMVTSPTISQSSGSPATSTQSTSQTASPVQSTNQQVLGAQAESTDHSAEHPKTNTSLAITILIIVVIVGGYFAYTNISSLGGLFSSTTSDETQTTEQDNSAQNQAMPAQVTENSEQTSSQSTALASDCGTSSLEILSSILLQDNKYESDTVVRCLSQRLSSCTPSKGNFNTKTVETSFSLSNANGCDFSLEFPDKDINKELAGKSVTCPIAIEDSSLFTPDGVKTDDPVLKLVQLYEFAYWGGKASQDITFDDVRKEGCRGNLIDYYESLFAESDNLPG